MKWWQPWVDAAAGLLYPSACVCCETALSGGEYLCVPCGEEARRIEAPFCRRCSLPFEGEFPEGAFTCSNCRDQKFAFDCAVSARRHTGVVRDLVQRFKYRGEHFLRRPLSAWLAEAWETDARLQDGPPVAALVPVPLHPQRRRERGFNQAESLCRLLGRHAGLPVWNALRRVRFTETQTHLARHERLENLRGAFATARRRPVSGAHLLLVDDVFTTGATVDECARVLRRAGAASVRVLTVARR